MNLVFSFIMIVSGGLIIIKQPEIILPILTNSSTKAVELSLRLLAIYAVWTGFLKICDESGVSNALAKALSPIIKFLFGNVSQKTATNISINMSANILGMGNAATPAGIAAINSLYEENLELIKKNKMKAIMPMIMLVVINATSLQLIPTSVISLRASFGSQNAGDIILPSIIATSISTIIGVALVKLFYSRRNRAKLENKNRHRMPKVSRHIMPKVISKK